MPTDHVTDLVATLHSHLEATGERPVAPKESRWLGEAEAIAADLRYAEDVDASTVRERCGKIERLLSEVEDTGDDEADEHVDAARRCLGRLEETLAEPS